MLKDTYIQKLLKQYRENKKVPPILARIVFHVLASAIEKHYGHPRGDKCLQYSYGALHLLKKFGISSILLQVEALTIHSEIDILGRINFSGFQGGNHHVACLSEYNELIDLSIHFLSLHPSTINPQSAINPPAVWWHKEDIKALEPTIRYKSVGEISLDLPKEDPRDLEEFLGIVDEVFANTAKKLKVSELDNRPILHNFDNFREMAKNEKNTWVNTAAKLLNSHLNS